MKSTAPRLAELAAHLTEDLQPVYPALHSCHFWRTQQGALVLMLSCPQAIPTQLLSDLGRVARRANALVELYALQINDGPLFTVQALHQIRPQDFEEPINPERVANLKGARDMLLRYALLTRTIIEVSREGVYISILMRHGGQPPGNPPLDVDECIGKPVAEIIGDEGHNTIVAAVQTAIAEQRPVHFAYRGQFRGEDFFREFQASADPKPDGSGAWLAVTRLG